ncbi:hypothetical protein BN874_560028 [Candidatus Contendobacter odensis Run_B_J11]|uniref:Uncharacterized protein n=1 Tax=Candidatus Contendobacter odensis Run_B_J11 TaxID=1400861 RepID=A0A7U7J5R4_9GAMM|nr:hypothetical protein BN874_560028 [Candidatus Contendobacter odensis Run_B_J11]
MPNSLRILIRNAVSPSIVIRFTPARDAVHYTHLERQGRRPDRVR